MFARQSDRKEALHFVPKSLIRIPDGANKEYPYFKRRGKP